MRAIRNTLRAAEHAKDEAVLSFAVAVVQLAFVMDQPTNGSGDQAVKLKVPWGVTR
jgi:hypothetical protein